MCEQPNYKNREEKLTGSVNGEKTLKNTPIGNVNSHRVDVPFFVDISMFENII